MLKPNNRISDGEYLDIAMGYTVENLAGSTTVMDAGQLHQQLSHCEGHTVRIDFCLKAGLRHILTENRKPGLSVFAG